MKKAFTLIELLAVIVILGIIAAIIIPSVSKTINNSKKSSAEKSAEGFIRAVELAELNYQLETGGMISQSIEDLSLTDSETKDVVVNSIVISESGEVTSASLSINGYTCNYSSGKAECSKNNTLSTPVVNTNPNEELISTLYNDGNSTAGLVADTYEPGRYYFRGANPKNKLILQENISGTITDVDYRIISFEADGTIKVVREERINTSGNAWDTTTNRPTADHSYCTSSYGCNAWSNQLNTYRNGTLMNDYFSLRYYASNTATDMTVNGTETGTKTTVTKDSSLNTYLNTTFLTTNLEPISDYIDEHMWDVGGIYYASGKSFEKDIAETKDNQWKGYIALPSIIDYINASDNTTQCINIYSGANVISGTSYYPCTKNSDGTVNNYLYKSGYTQWSLSAIASNRYFVWFVYSSGYFNYYNAGYTYGARSAFYLKSTIKLTGEGTTGNEFTIAES